MNSLFRKIFCIFLAPILAIASCGPDPNAPPFPSDVLVNWQVQNPAISCASTRLYRDALKNGGVLVAQNGFARSTTNEEERKALDFLEAWIAYRGYDCSATFAASPQQFVNYLDSSTIYFIPPMYPRVKNAKKKRLQFGDPMPENQYITTSSAINSAPPRDSLREAESLLWLGSALMGGAQTSSLGETCYKVSERTSGFNRLCEYSCTSGNIVRTIASTQLCLLHVRN